MRARCSDYLAWKSHPGLAAVQTQKLGSQAEKTSPCPGGLYPLTRELNVTHRKSFRGVIITTLGASQEAPSSPCMGTSPSGSKEELGLQGSWVQPLSRGTQQGEGWLWGGETALEGRKGPDCWGLWAGLDNVYIQAIGNRKPPHNF